MLCSGVTECDCCHVCVSLWLHAVYHSGYVLCSGALCHSLSSIAPLSDTAEIASSISCRHSVSPFKFDIPKLLFIFETNIFLQHQNLLWRHQRHYLLVIVLVVWSSYQCYFVSHLATGRKNFDSIANCFLENLKKKSSCTAMTKPISNSKYNSYLNI